MMRFSLCVLLMAATAAPAGDVAIGTRAGNLTFKDIRYLPRSLDDFPGATAYVLAFTSTSCPLAQRYLPVLKELEAEYRSRGVQFLSVNVGADDSIVQMAAQALKYDIAFPFVKDFDAVSAEKLGVQRTPEVVVLDKQRTLCYRGRIDDQYRLGGTRNAPTRQDLKEALEAVLAGKPVSVAQTPVDGCTITKSALAAAELPVTFAEHVAPILRKHCQQCHQPNTAAPFALIGYKEAAARADALVEAVSDGRMPPWYASEEHGTFTNRRGLSAQERDRLVQWVRGGKLPGDESKLPPPPPARTERWDIGKPDLILQAPKHNLPASGDIPYKYVMLPYVFLSDTWMQGIQILPDNPRAVHHCNMAYIAAGDKDKKSNFITGTVPGGAPMVLEHGVGFRIPKGSGLILQIHYVSTGKEENCQIAVGFKYASGMVRKQLQHKLMADYRFAIPPEAPFHAVKASKTLEQDAIGVGMFVHMHLRGRDMTFAARYPDGKNETLLVVPNYSFDWQIPYVWEPGSKRFPAGTKLECLAHYDNSSFNPYNPNAKTTVREGQMTHQEMMNGFFFYVNANEDLNLDIDGKSGKPRVAKP